MALMDLDLFEEQVKGVAALENSLSRRAYELVIEQGWVSRDEAAATLDSARSVAAFHLEKLVKSGLLKVRYERLSGKRGPGAGRPTKLYGRSDRDFDLSLPPRRYDLAGSLLADAITRAKSEGTPIGEAVTQVAREAGQRVGLENSAANHEAVDEMALIHVLERHGYEPKKLGSQITMLNCPFDNLAEQYRDLVCGMNLEFISGVVDGLGESDEYTARLLPETGYCCVRLDAK